MKLHRFYLPESELSQKLWVHDERLLHQWLRVLRFRQGSKLILFDGNKTERLYKIFKIEDSSCGLELVTEMVPKVPSRDVYLFWVPLKKDNNDIVLQKGTELGVSHFVPVFAERSVVTDFNVERAKKILIEAAEQCGRVDIPRIREAIDLRTAVEEFDGKIALYFAEYDEKPTPEINQDEVGVFVGPEGGWSDAEIKFLSERCQRLPLSEFTLRAETAAIVAVSVLGGR